MKQNLVLTSLVYFFITLTVQGQIDSAEKADSLFKKWDSSDTGGAAIAVVKNGEIVFSNAYGMANLEYGIPNTVTTVFHAASLSKQFTAYSILLLEQEGKLSLDDDIRIYIPEVPDFGKKITLRHLASHTSGLRDQWRLLYLAGWRPDDVVLNQDILDLVAKQTDLNFEPGSRLSYSNTGFTLLAEVVTRVSGKSFAEFTKEKIFGPLKMDHTQFYDDHNKIVKNRAYSYQLVDGALKKDKLNFSTVGATSLFTTVMDLTKWAVYLNTLDTKNNQLSRRMNTRASLNNGEVTEASMGQWAGVKYKGMEWFDHTGSDASFRAYLSRFPESNSAVVVLANTTPFNATNQGLKTADIFLSEYFKTEGGSPQNKNDQPKKDYDYIKLSNKELAKFCGKYWELDERYDREIKLINDTLVYYRSKSSQTKLLPISENEFKMIGDSNDVSVIFGNGNNESDMQLIINDGRRVDFAKYEESFSKDPYKGMYYNGEVEREIQVTIENGHVFLTLFKQDPIKLIPIKKDLFTSENRNFQKVEFVRNSEDEITGLLINNSGIVKMEFSKN
ncbi:serine hydrolase domain-containing protein [Fulvivirgaceae bacterium LMO-SS25]